MIEYLEWDSDFFKKKIGKINYPEDLVSYNLESLLNQARSDSYDLVYCFGNERLDIDEAILKEYNGRLVDRKVIFAGATNTNVEVSQSIKEYIDIEPDKDLIQLAYLSGDHSRYKLDPRFNESEFERLYQTWIKNSLNKKIADKVFVCCKDDDIVGFVTVRKMPEYGQIGLIATNSNHQGMGYGRILVDAVKKYLSDINIYNLEVATQLDNTGACLFYRKCGLSEKTVNNIYHFWL